MSMVEKARELRMIIETLANTLDDETALNNTELFAYWSGDGVEYTVGTKVRYEDKLYKVLQAHTSQEDWTPTNAPSLFAEVLAGQDGTDIGEWVQPDSTNPYMMGDRVIFEGVVYESTIDNNVWSPAVYGWKVVE